MGTAQSEEAAEGTQGSFVVWVCFGKGMGCTCACVCERVHVCLGVSHACEWGCHTRAGAGALLSVPAVSAD